MGKKTGKKTQIRLDLDDDPELLHKFEKIQQKLGIHSNIDVIRTLIHQKYDELFPKKEIP